VPKGKGRRSVQTLDSSELSHYEEVYETIGDKLSGFNLMAMLKITTFAKKTVEIKYAKIIVYIPKISL